MTACNFRSLLLAAIVLSNCISWTASRHHYTHNVHQHRTRHRRQGAGLYLSASYVIPGGEGGGAWGEWGEVSPCSRTCGGGVASQKRICLQIGPDSRPQCTGGDTKYFSCQTQDCPAGAIDFRAEQCAEFDDKDFRGFRYNWVPYTKAPNPCELNCMPHGERFYFRHKLKVTDGTRCNDESFDVCVDGICQPVGCDMMLGSNAREDNCRECRGNGTNCHTSSGIFDSQDLVKGYNDILLIPQGSTTIVIEEIRPSNNYLALRAKNGTYYLNGHYHIDFPRSIMIAGALWSYERSQQGYAAPDKLRCLGPTTEPLYLSLLLQDTNVGIRYEYSIPNNTAPPTDKRYNWVHEDFTPCSATCGGGFQTRNVTCRSREELEIVDDSLCDEGLKPPTNQSCNPDPCPAQWVEGPWGNCSKRCGSEGVSSREVTCQQVIANGVSSIVPDKKCFDLLGPKPELFQECNRDAPCPTWFVGHWKPCDKLCDEGKQTRQVVCYQKNNGRVELLDDEDCTDEKPELEKPCMLKPCDGVDWVTTAWSGCDTCLSKVRTRLVVCSTKYQKVMNESFCLYHTRPADREECDEKKLPPCEVQWYATQWSKCSVDCGEGVQTRKVFCGLYDGDNVAVVEDAKCADLPKYNDTKPCSVPKEKCPSQWFAGPWMACSKECGGGERDRRVMCLRGDEHVNDCDGNVVLDSTEMCNMQPCDKDETLPLDSKSTPIMDEEECDYDTDYPEVGLDADSLTSTTLDTMLSDSPSYAEFESTLKETGSGMGITLAEEALTLYEGSGTFSTDFGSSNTTDTEPESPTGTTPTGETKLSESSVSTSATTPASDTNVTVETTSSGTDSTGNTPTNSTGSTSSEETDSTESDSTDETRSTLTDDNDSTSSDETGSTESSATHATGSTPTGSTGLTSTAKPGSTKSATDETGSTPTNVTDSTSTGKTDSTKSSVTDATGSTPTDGTGSTKSAADKTGSTPTNETDSTSTDKTDSTKSSATDATGSTPTDGTGSTSSDETGSTESSATHATGSTPTGSTGLTSTAKPGSTKSATDETGSTPTNVTDSTSTGKTDSTKSSVTDATGSTPTDGTGSTSSDETGSTESSATDETGSIPTDSTGLTSSAKPGPSKSATDEIRSTPTDSTGLTSSAKPGSTKSATDEIGSTPTDSTGSTSSDETGSTESSATDETGSTPTDSTGLTSSAKPGPSKSGTDEVGSTPTDSTGLTSSAKPGPSKSGTDEVGSTPTDSTGLTSSAKPGPSKSGTDEVGSTPTDSTGLISSAKPGSTKSATDEIGSTPTDSTGSTSSDETGSTESSATDETGSTPTDSTGSTSADETGSTESSATHATGSTPTGSTGLTSTAKPGSTKSATDETGSTPTDGTGSTESSATDETGSTPTNVTDSTSTGKTDSTKSSVTDATGSTPTDGTGSTKSAADETGSTPTNVTDSTSTGKTDSTKSSVTDATGSTPTNSTGSTESSATDETVSTPTDGTGSTESSATDETGSTLTDSTGLTSSAKPGSTKSATDETGSTPTDSTSSTSLDVTGSTESSATDETGSTATGETKETISTGNTESTISSTSKKGSTDASASTNVSGSTKSKGTDSTNTEETETTVPGETISTESTGSTESSAGNTGSTITESSAKSTVETGTSSESLPTEISTESSSSISSESTEESTTVAEGSTRTSLSSDAKKSTHSGTTEISESTATESSGSSVTTELSTIISETTHETSTSSKSESTTEPGATISTSTRSGSSTLLSSTSGPDSTIASSTSSGSIETTELSTLISEDSSTEITGTSTVSGSEFTTEAGESSSTISPESTEEGSSTVSGMTELTTAKATESTVEGSSESTSETGSTEVFGSTTEGPSSTEGSTIEGITISTGKTTWDLSTTLGRRRPAACKPRRKPKCEKTEFGCCPDKKTAAAGPFDEGCLKPRTCKESLYGCCPDGLSPALGDNEEGCPIEPCADTLFGCCLSDNKTAAQGNDQDGCPLPPPACASSEFGCCADNETEATGPEKEGCPEFETTSTTAVTEETSESTTFNETSEASTPSEASESSESSTFSETSESSESSTFSETSESSESSTFSEASTAVIGSTTLGHCASFEFGCCGDNETEATGPDGQGCPCNAAEFGCCPDGVSPAQGVEMDGCPGHCSTSPHGCCADNKTPAHGPDFEGCCLLQAYGCCPDNRKPAEGPHLEGCGCQYAAYGCCPDNVTAAQGPDNEGCGCAYTEHGCCPDRHTAASGPDNEGCSCNTFQFGCCEDGVTVANGPDQQGCKCVDSKYGCCGDGETPATGPNAAGCDCSSSKYGCCPDGHTEATGPKFAGCTDAPENKQAVCRLPTDAGPCHNFTAVWFYDLAYGGCTRFWYGGCEGNGNRFATKEDCEDVCVQPAPRDACKLPSVKGPCTGDYVRWYYNSSREQCIPFRYGGCLGNANNFDTREVCQAQCEPARTTGQCNLPIEQGPCAGLFSRWGFNTETHTCEQFTWGGCEGNGNRFKTKAACQLHCDPPGTLKPDCTQRQEAGTCGGKEALWSFSISENRCVPFYYSGCGGNGNRFESRETCEQTCPSAYEADKCTLPAETGECSNYRERWFYDTSNKRCRQFYYGGCGGNENNFVTEAECEKSCSETPPPDTTTTTTRKPQPQPEPEQPQQPESEPERPDFCLLAIDPGPCTNMQTKYAYDSDLGRCRTFEYGGCGGNRNNFPDETFCTEYCHPVQDICQLPMLSGPCDESLMRWFYDSATDSCSQFTYGGCEGNDNRFDSLEACESRCKTGPAQTTLRTTNAPRGEEAIPAECRVSEALEECYNAGEVWYFDQNLHECVAHSNQESGSSCRHTGTFNSQEACERACGAFMGVDVCQQRLDPGPCDGYVTKVYFDAAAGECREFSYGGCLGGANRFSTIEECTQICKPETDPCSLPPEQGNCYSYTQQWYYDASHGQCYEFMYTGCSGNENRFGSQGECEARCKRPALVTTTTPASLIPPQKPEAECTTPSSLAPCGENVTVFYYDSEKRQCLAGGFGNCGHPNTYNTEEECERRCGAFAGINVCGERLDPGPCRASIPKFYWDSITASCQPFAYGGCLGGSNRFSTIAECQYVCGDTGPARECLQPVDLGESCAGAPPVMRWHYSAAHVGCVVFAYQGCGGNDNNFRSYDQCLDVCGLSNMRGDDSNEVLPPDCNVFREECEVLDCQYGIDRFIENGCERCKCVEDPCVRANCSPSERCVASAVRDPATGEPRYSARCVTESTKASECARYAAECASLECEYGVQRTSTPAGCERCACAPQLIDCAPLDDECRRLHCPYGMDVAIGSDGCTRCKCKPDPCELQSCAAGERCIVVPFRNSVDMETKYTSECRTIEKPGVCPPEEPSNEVTCRHECQDDSECRGVGKCCRRGCSRICTLPAEPTAPHPLLTTTHAPEVPAPPQAITAQEPQVSAAEGGTATLRCLFHGNPPPKITWRRGELTIDGTVGRYRLTSDGALEIVSLYRNDTGVYICVADNGLGVARQEIHLVVNDPVRSPVGIAGDENAVVTGELGQPMKVRCLAYGYPQPTVFWYRGLEDTLVPFNDAVYEARGNDLLIRSLAIETLGKYTCQAYNGEGKAASWVVSVQAYKPEGIFLENEYLVPRYTSSPLFKPQPPTTKDTTTTTTTTTEARIPMFTVPVNTHVSTPYTTLNVGTELRLTCEVDGFPEPDVYWTKDGARIQTDSRITISGSTIVSRLSVSRVSVADSGLYTCHASNLFSSHSDTAQINVQQQTVPAKCTDNPFFANCDLIVRSNFCRHKYYSKFCCKSCVEAGQLDPQDAELQADQPYRRK